jgi:hypothetical protein
MLTTAKDQATSLTHQGKNAEDERIQREVYVNTLTSATNLATSLADQGKNAEAEHMLQATLASCQRMLGPAHPTTLHTTRNLETVRARNAAPTRRPSQPLAHRSRCPPARGCSCSGSSPSPSTQQARARAVVRRAHRPVCGDAGRREEAVAQGGVRGAGGLRGGGMRVGGGEQRVRAVQGGAVLLARVPAPGLEGAQGCVRSLKRRSLVREALALPHSGYAPTNKASSNCGRNSPRMSAAIFLAGFSRRRRWGHHRQREEADAAEVKTDKPTPG